MPGGLVGIASPAHLSTGISKGVPIHAAFKWSGADSDICRIPNNLYTCIVNSGHALKTPNTKGLPISYKKICYMYIVNSGHGLKTPNTNLMYLSVVLWNRRTDALIYAKYLYLCKTYMYFGSPSEMDTKSTNDHLFLPGIKNMSARGRKSLRMSTFSNACSHCHMWKLHVTVVVWQ